MSVVAHQVRWRDADGAYALRAAFEEIHVQFRGVPHGDAATLLTGTDLGPADHLAVAIPDFYPVVVLDSNCRGIDRRDFYAGTAALKP